MNLRKSLLISTLALTALIAPLNALIVGVNAADGTLGSNFTVGNDVNAAGGTYIVSTVNLPGTAPTTADSVATYGLTFADAGSYDLWVRYLMEVDNTNNDSFFSATAFGSGNDVNSDAAWTSNNTLPYNSGVYTWVNLSVDTGRLSSEVAPTFTGTNGAALFELGARETQIRINGFAFVTSGETPTESALNQSIVPEPGTYALLLGGLALVATVLNRRFRK